MLHSREITSLIFVRFRMTVWYQVRGMLQSSGNTLSTLAATVLQPSSIPQAHTNPISSFVVSSNGHQLISTSMESNKKRATY